MIKMGLLIMLLNILTASAKAQVNATLSIKNITKAKGNMMLLIENASGKEILKVVVPITNKNFTYEMNLPVKGKYAISVYQDINKNNKLDKNFFGAPTELFGFSNNPKVKFSAPDLASKLVTINTGSTRTIFLK
jgi:uncharacterized protein (DUF2141 family)